MGYAAVSFVAGEQPTTSKWNTLGTNDASFNDGTGLPMFGAAAASVSGAETTTSTSYAALGTAQAVTVTVGNTGNLLFGFNAELCSNNTNAAFCYAAPILSGANVLAASDTNAVVHQDASANVARSLSRVYYLTGLTPGSTVITMNFKVATGGAGAGTGSWTGRRLWAIPL